MTAQIWMEKNSLALGDGWVDEYVDGNASSLLDNSLLLHEDCHFNCLWLSVEAPSAAIQTGSKAQLWTSLLSESGSWYV
jgi:hypothetical protein